MRAMRAKYLEDDCRVMLETEDGSPVVLLNIDDFDDLFGPALCVAVRQKLTIEIVVKERKPDEKKS